MGKMRTGQPRPYTGLSFIAEHSQKNNPRQQRFMSQMPIFATITKKTWSYEESED